MTDGFDCVVCGEVCIDLPVRPINRHQPLRDMETVRVDAIQPGGGGIVSNSGMAMAKMGLRVAAFGCVGNDVWGDVLAKLFDSAGLDTRHLLRHADLATSATAVLVGEDGEHTFAYHAGASHQLTRQRILENLELFAQSRFAFFGYYGLMPELEDDLPDVLSQVQQAGCRTALDAAAGGGDMKPLDRILPFLDIYVPSYGEAMSQTGLEDPRQMIEAFRAYNKSGLLGVKLGELGALLSPAAGDFVRIEPVEPPGDLVDTTGAGDCFYSGLIVGLARGLNVQQAGRTAAAAGACSVTKVGAVAGIRSFEETRKLAGIEL